MAPLDLAAHVPPCASEEEHIERHYAEVFPDGAPTLPQSLPTLLDFADACRDTRAAECESDDLDLDAIGVGPDLWGEDGPERGQTITIAGSGVGARWNGHSWELA